MEKKPLHFKEGAKVHFSYCFPYETDFSGCDEVFLKNILFPWDYKLNLKFKDGAKVKLKHLSNVELSGLDFSKCDEVLIRHCEREGKSLMKFKDGAKVTLECFRHYCPIDFSNCEVLKLKDVELYQTERVVFKNRKQMEDSYFIKPNNWNGQIVFSDELQHPSLDLALAAKNKGGR